VVPGCYPDAAAAYLVQSPITGIGPKRVVYRLAHLAKHIEVPTRPTAGRLSAPMSTRPPGNWKREYSLALYRLPFELADIQMLVEASLVQQLLVRSLFDDLPIVDY